MNQPRDRRFRLPDLEGGLLVSRRILRARTWTQFVLDSFVVGGFAALLWRFGNVGTLTLIAVVLSGYLGGLFLRGMQAYRERVRLVGTITELADSGEAKILWDEVNALGHSIFWKLVGSVLTGVGATVGAIMTDSVWWLIILCIPGLAYALALYRIVSPAMSVLGRTIPAANDSRFRILLFRAFGPDAAKLAKESLIPQLAGYGSVDLVVDPTMESIVGSGSFDLASAEWSRFCRIHRFSNDEWQERVGELLNVSDMAVIDVGRTSDGVMWEVAESYRRLPPWRVWLLLDIAPYSEPGALSDYYSEFYRILGSSPDVPRDVRFPWSYFVGGGWIHLEFMADQFYRRMIALVGIETGQLDPSDYQGKGVSP